MPAAVETSIDGLKAAFASRKEPAWHGLGTVFDEDLSLDEMMELAHLTNWDVRLEPVVFPEGYRSEVDSYMCIRDNPFDGGIDVLSIVGQRYHPYQNEALGQFAEHLLDGQLRAETGGSINGGRRVFLSMVDKNEIVLDPDGSADTIKQYLLMSTSHDGTAAIQASMTPVRVVCQNTLNVALRTAAQTFKIRHTQTAEGRILEARKALGIQAAYFDTFSEEAHKMIQTTITNAKFMEIVDALYPKSDNESKASKTRHAKKVELLESIYLGNADGPDTTSTIRGTAWGAFNALTEALDWYRKPRKGNAESVLAAASGFDPVTTAEKNRIRSAVLALA